MISYNIANSIKLLPFDDNGNILVQDNKNDIYKILFSGELRNKNWSSSGGDSGLVNLSA
jgi:hypothetical protein